MEHYNSHSPADDEHPRTPSPPQMAHRYAADYSKADLDPVRIYTQDDAPDYQQQYRAPTLLQELYADNNPASLSPEHDMYLDSHDWPQQQRPADYHMIRRATYPCAKQERDDLAPYPPFLNHDTGVGNYAPMSAEPSALHGEYEDPSMKLEESVDHLRYHHHQQQHQTPPQQFYRPQQQQQHPAAHLPHHYAPPPQHPHHPYMAQHAHGYPGHPAHGGLPHAPHGYPPHGLPVQHTDDAASKETQYLRRRCFNCHTTEPPSWRRSTLNPGKIVCNKCGLYERTHLRARPLRFDELRAGGKARKGGKGAASPKGAAKKGLGVPAAPLARRNSVSSTGSSVQSGSGASDWDDTVSVYSNGSAPPTSFNSPALGYSPHPPSLSLSSNSSNSPGERDSLSRSPPLLGSPPGSSGGNGIRLPHAPDMGHGLRTKPRSNTTGGLGLGGGYYSSHHGHGLHHSSSNSSLHSLSSQHSGLGSPSMAPSPPMQEAPTGELYRRGSMPEMQPSSHSWGSEMGGVSVKEEPRAVLV
ncbi:hypothetical protein FB45DRAFT_427743 [Roridomyces roridus]|uniref:GATA-type domain-containing protein n=1 Tax=Roridomyces roridus TaxID=1738132 RepID=A0AAD7C605_9AGAR|nr:hypothetical protein FB45DRAFT_427743 [Roridomyces roridus]